MAMERRPPLFYQNSEGEINKTPRQILYEKIENGTYTMEELIVARDAKVITQEEFDLIIEKRKL